MGVNKSGSLKARTYVAPFSEINYLASKVKQ